MEMNMSYEECAAFVDRLIELSNTPPLATDAEVEAMKSVLDRLWPLEYDEYIVSCPKLTEEDLLANHAAGLPVMEKIVRCRACRNTAPYGDGIECIGPLVQTWDYWNDEPMHNPVPPDGFCAWGVRREVDE